ncbi:MAG: acyl-CoA thioesterase, partial [Deltaproteobacteria bacterium]|nr:acyl-CoA thioesterase [Deltaproteobacteria bacterium]
YGISYGDFFGHGVVVPIRKMHIDYHHPLRLRETAHIEGILQWSEAARINLEYVIKNGKGRMTTSGYTVQMMLDMEENIRMVPPPFYKEFLEKWKKGELRR